MPYEIALIGGTGPEGRGLAVRLALAGHRIVIGSREAERAVAAAAEVTRVVRAAGRAADVHGATNAEAATAATLAIVTVPFEAHRTTLEALGPALAGKVVIDAVVPMRFERGPRVVDVPEGSATEQAAAILPGSDIVGAFHTVAAQLLLDLGGELRQDVLVTGDDATAKQTVIELVSTVDGLRGLDAGRLRYSRFVEGITVLLVGINARYDAHAGIQIVGLPA